MCHLTSLVYPFLSFSFSFPGFMQGLLGCVHRRVSAMHDPKNIFFMVNVCWSYLCLAPEQVSYYLPGYLPPEQIFVPPARASDSIIMGAYAEQGLAFEGELQLHLASRHIHARCDCSAFQRPLISFPCRSTTIASLYALHAQSCKLRL